MAEAAVEEEEGNQCIRRDCWQAFTRRQKEFESSRRLVGPLSDTLWSAWAVEQVSKPTAMMQDRAKNRRRKVNIQVLCFTLGCQQ